MFDVIFYTLKRKTNTYRTTSRQHKSRCLHLLKLYVIQCYAPVITLTSSARLRYIIRHVSTISRSQIRYFHKVCHEYTSTHSDILIIVFVCLHITYCSFLACNKEDHFSPICMCFGLSDHGILKVKPEKQKRKHLSYTHICNDPRVFVAN